MSRALVWRRFLSAVAVTLVVVSGAAAVHPVLATTPDAGAQSAVHSGTTGGGSSDLVTARPDMVSARIAAAAQGSRVEVTSLEDAYSTTYVNADGTLTTDSSPTPIRVQQDGAWVDADFDLQHVDGGWSPKASPVPVTFSDGGDKDAATVGDGSKQVDVSWAVTLPAPKIDGAVATYDLGGGETLVLTATVSGFEQSLVLAQAPTSLPHIKLPLDTADLTMTANASNGFDFVNSSSAAVYTMPAPVMYGADIDPDTEEPTQSKVVSASLVQTADGPQLDLTPSMSWLTDPSTVYPVTIDPTVASVTKFGDTYVQDNVSTSMVSDWALHAGWYGGHAARSYLNFSGITDYANDDILSASLNLWNWNVNTCTAATIHAYPLTQAGALYGSTNWTNKPTFTTSASYAGSASFAHGIDGTCANAAASIDLTKMATAWANGTLTNYGVQLSGTESTGNQGWAFCSMNYDTNPNDPNSCTTTSHTPTLSVTYNSYPGTPSAMSVAPCVTNCTTAFYNNSATPKLSAKIGDADGGTLRQDYEIDTDVSGSPGTVVTTGSVSNVTAGSTGTWTVPSGRLSSRYWYFYRVRGYDGTDYGPWSGYTHFIVDTNAPATPAITSTAFTAGSWSGASQGTISWSDTSGDVASYSWALDGTNWSTPSTATSLSLNNLPQDAIHTLQVQATDTVGNVSSVGAFVFGVGSGGLVTPDQGDSTQAQVNLTAAGKPSLPYVYYQWRQGSTNQWATIPPTDVTLPGTNTHPTIWPTVNISGTYVWNLGDTVTRGHGVDGDVQVQACLSASSDGSGPACQATPTDVQLSAHSFDDANATQRIGPGVLSLLTGDYAVGVADASIAAYNGSFGVSRSATTLAPAAASGTATGVFGPGWTASLDGPQDAGAAGMTPIISKDTSYIKLTNSDGGEAEYTTQPSQLTSNPISYTGIGDADDGSTMTLDMVAGTLSLLDLGGTRTTWTQQNGAWVPASVVMTGTAAQTTTSYYYVASGAAAGLPSQIVAASPAGIDCTTSAKATTTEGCRSLSFSYSSVSVGSGSVERLTGISLVAWDPGSSTMRAIPIEGYDYDLTGRLAHAWDPRISQTFNTAYTYDADGRLSTLTPPGLASWQFNYNTSNPSGCPNGAAGCLSSVTRPDPSGNSAISTIVYDVPLSGGGLPDVTGATSAKWNEINDLPTTGTAVFSADHAMSAGTTASTVTAADWPYAQISYLDVNGENVNGAVYGANAWQIDTTQHDASGNAIWTLDAGNRAQALSPTDDTDPYVAALPNSQSAQRAGLLSTVNMYSSNGGELVDKQGPIHPVTRGDGSVIDARSHIVTSYDEGAPGGSTYLLPTTTKSSALGTDGTNYDTQTTHSGYAAIEPLDQTGWALRTPTSTTDAGGLMTAMRYNDAGQIIETRLPGDSDGTTPRTTTTSYYTASGTGACVNPAFAGLTCQAAPGGQPSTGNPLPIITYTYNLYGSVASETEIYGTGGSSVVRTTSMTYDNADRPSTKSIAVSPASSGGTALPAVHYTYNASSGLLTVASTTVGGTTTSLTTGYDSIGQAVTYTDAGGNLSATKYDIDGRPISLDDGMGKTTYTYDSATEHRGVVTSEDIGVPGAPSTFTAQYDAAGNVKAETFPNGLTAVRKYDNVGGISLLTYTMAGVTWLTFGQTRDSHGHINTQNSPGSNQNFTYDASDRLTGVQDSVLDPNSGVVKCKTRVYAYNINSDRTSLSSYPDGGGDPANGACATSTSPATVTSTFDQADRITNAGYSYDAIGRTLTVPGADAQGTGAHVGAAGPLTIGYYSNDMVASESQGASNASFGLDPDQNRVTQSTQGATIVSNHFSGDGDSPTWSQSSASTWSRNIQGLDGYLGAIVNQAGSVSLQVSDLRGNVVASVDDSSTATGTTSYSESTEFGAPRVASNAYVPYGWLGDQQRSGDSLGGVMLMGVRLYNPVTGRFLSSDPIPGGNDNAYTWPSDPISSSDPTGRSASSSYFTIFVWLKDRYGSIFPFRWGRVQHVTDKHDLGYRTVAAAVAHFYTRKPEGQENHIYLSKVYKYTCRSTFFLQSCTIEGSVTIRTIVSGKTSFGSPTYDGYTYGVVSSYCLGPVVCPSWVNETLEAKRGDGITADHG